jgi:hypothetical protein
MEFIENHRRNWKEKVLECPAQESHSKFSVTNQKYENLWKDPPHAGMRL